MARIENIPLNIKNGMRCAKKCFFIILAAAISGMPTPEICFLPGQLRRMLLSKTSSGDSLSVGESNIQPSNCEEVALSLNQGRPSDIFSANA